MRVPGLRRGGHRSARDHDRILRWMAASRGSAAGTAAVVEPRTVRRCLARVLPADEPGAMALARWVEDAGADLGPVAVPMCPVHGDLAPSNCFVHRGRVRVADWEGAALEGSPPAETLLFLNHYARAIPGGNARMRRPADTFREAFLGDGWLGTLTRSTRHRELRELGLPAEAGRYLFVATLVTWREGTPPPHTPGARGHGGTGRPCWRCTPPTGGADTEAPTAGHADRCGERRRAGHRRGAPAALGNVGAAWHHHEDE